MMSFFLISTPALGKLKVSILQIAKPDTSVYELPSFDARILVNLKRGQKLYGLNKKIVGTDGFGLFYKVRLKKNVYGYILDTSVKKFKEARNKRKGRISGRALKKRQHKAKTVSSYDGYSVPYSKSYGLVFSSLSYVLDINKNTEKSKEMFFGGKISGAGWGISSFPLDISLLFSPSSPSLLDSFTQDHSGFMVLSEVGLPFEINRGFNWSIYASISGVLSYYSFDLILNGAKESSNKAELGISGGLGAGIRIGRYIFNLESKYIKLSNNHTGFEFSVKRIF